MTEHLHDTTGATNLYAVIVNASGQRWRGGATDAFESFTVANWTEYKIALSESPASSYRYPITIPAEITEPQLLTIYVYEQIGESPSPSDTLLDSETIDHLRSDGSLIPFTIKTTAGAVVPYCEVTITTTNASDTNNVVQSGHANAGGKVDFRLKPGTYYLWRNKRLHSFDDPAEIVIATDGTLTYSEL